MRQNQELKFVFHNPNTGRLTEEFFTKWFTKVCVPQLEQIVREKMDAEKTDTILSQEEAFL